MFQHDLFIKPTHSGSCLPYTSYVPSIRKKNLIFNEFLRAKQVSSTPALIKRSEEKVTSKLLANGYPNNFINSSNKKSPDVNLNKPEPISFLKLPYISPSQQSKISKLLKSTKLQDKIRIVYTTERPLAWQFRGARPNQNCPPLCVACSTSTKENSCFTRMLSI